MANPRDEYDYEPKPEKVKKEKPVQKTKKKGGIIGKIVALGLGFVLGVGSVYGSWALTGLGVALIPIGKTVGMIDYFVPADVYATMFGGTDENDNPTAGILAPEYAEKRVGGLFGDVTKAIIGVSNSNGSIGALNDTFPIIGTGVDELLKSLNDLSLDVDRDELLEQPFSSLGKYVGDAFMNAPAGDVLGSIVGGEMPEILMMLCYGEKDVDYTVDADGKVSMINGEKIKLNELFSQDMTALLDNVTIDTFLTIDPTDPEQEMMMSIAYGDPERYTVQNNSVIMNQIVYTYENGTFYDEEGVAIAGSFTRPQSGSDPYVLSIDNGTGTMTTLYAKLKNDNSAPVYIDFACSVPLRYKKNTVASLSESAKNIINDVTLESVLNLNDKSHPVLLSLGYGTKGVDYKIENGEIVMLGDSTPRTIKDLTDLGGNLINDIPLSDLIGNSEETLVNYLLYGKENVHYKKDGDTVTMQQKFIYVANGDIYNEYEELLDDLTFNTRFETYVEDETTYYCTVDKFDVLLKNGEYATKYLVYADEYYEDEILFSATTLGDFSGKNNLFSKITSRLTIGELMTNIDDNRILHLLKDETIASLPTAINTLKLTNVYPDMIYDKYNNLSGEWEYLLTDPTGNMAPEEYTINDMDKLISNMKQNIQHATLNDLQKHGLIESDTDLQIEIKREISLHGGAYYHNFLWEPELDFLYDYSLRYIGDLTVSQTMTYMLVVFEVVSDWESLYA